MSFDTRQFFDDYEIDYSISGKNTTRGWMQIPCFFPDCSDHSRHMGVNISSGTYHCWICDRKGPAEIMAAKLLNVNLRKAEEICKKYRNDFLPSQEQTVKHVLKVETKGFSSLQQMHRNYLISRNFDPDYLQRKYKIGGFGLIGRFPYRIGIPVYYNGRLVNMTARDVTGQQKERYLSLKNEEANIDIKDCIYNFDNIQSNGNILIVEGCFDAWRIGGSTCSLFGTAKSYSQILKILSKQPRNIFILFDSGEKAQKIASKLAYSFSPFVKHVENLEIPDVKDPAELSNDDALVLRNELNI